MWITKKLKQVFSWDIILLSKNSRDRNSQIWLKGHRLSICISYKRIRKMGNWDRESAVIDKMIGNVYMSKRDFIKGVFQND